MEGEILYESTKLEGRAMLKLFFRKLKKCYNLKKNLGHILCVWSIEETFVAQIFGFALILRSDKKCFGQTKI